MSKIYRNHKRNKIRSYAVITKKKRVKEIVIFCGRKQIFQRKRTAINFIAEHKKDYYNELYIVPYK